MDFILDIELFVDTLTRIATEKLSKYVRISILHAEFYSCFLFRDFSCFSENRVHNNRFTPCLQEYLPSESPGDGSNGDGHIHSASRTGWGVDTNSKAFNAHAHQLDTVRNNEFLFMIPSQNLPA